MVGQEDLIGPLSRQSMPGTGDEKDLMATTPFGRPMRDTHFLFAPAYNPLNHGSFGTYPKAVQTQFRHCQDMSEARPDTFVRYDIPRLLDESRAAMASYLQVPVDEIVFVPNATTASNIVLRALRFEQNDVVVHMSTVYGAVEKTVEYLRETTPVENVAVEVKYPISDDDLVVKFQDAIKGARVEGKKVRLACLDTISSMPGVLLPWERLVALCKEEGILSLVDGAHGVGHLDLNLPNVEPDFLVSNLHKWLFVPRSCAVFYVPKRNQHIIRSSLPTSHGFEPLPRAEKLKKIVNPLPMGGKSPFVLLFEFVATIDVSPYLCVEEALRFRSEACGGERKIMEYCRYISDEAGKQAAELFETEIMDNAEGTLNLGAFSNVRLPISLGTGTGEVPEDEAGKVVYWIGERLTKDYDTFAALYVHAGAFWVRFSGQIYLELEDFEKGARAIKALCERVGAGEYR